VPLSSSYGLIVEGIYDVPVFERLTERLVPGVKFVKSYPAGGKAKVINNYPSLLWRFANSVMGAAVQRGIVICDSNGKDPIEIETTMAARTDLNKYPFRHGVQFHATSQETETWLLADHVAINSVAAERGTGASVGPFSESHLESLPNAKEEFIKILTAANLPYTPEVCGEIAGKIDLVRLRAACPGFSRFEAKLT